MPKRKSPRGKRPSKQGRGKVLERALGPAADAFGRELIPLGAEAGETANRVGHLLVQGVEGLVFGIETIAGWLRREVAKRLKGRPTEKIVAPNPRIAVPAVQALVYSMSDDLIREMYANLLAADMDADRKHGAHPAFVELIKEMTPADVRVLSAIQKEPQIRFRLGLTDSGRFWEADVAFTFEVPGLDRHHIDLSLQNLERLGFVEVRPGEFRGGNPTFNEKEQAALAMYDDMARKLVGNNSELQALGFLPNSHPSAVAMKAGIYMTGFGVEFLKVCLQARD